MIFRYSILYVDDVEATLDFYEKAFGFQKAFLHDSGDYGELVTGETKLAFSSVALMRQLGKNPKAAEPKRPTFEIAFETDDVASALNKAISAGAAVVQELRHEEWGQTTAYVADLNGYLIELCSPVGTSG